MTISISKLYNNWIECEYDYEAMKCEYNRLYNAICSFKENGLITKEKAKFEISKLNKVINTFYYLSEKI